jgi:hypothetical protein
MNPFESLKRARARAKELRAAELEEARASAAAREEAQKHAERAREHVAYCLLQDRATLRRDPERDALRDDRYDRYDHDHYLWPEADSLAKEVTLEELEQQRRDLEPALEEYYRRYHVAQEVEEARKDAYYLRCVEAYKSRPSFEPTPSALAEELGVLKDVEEVSENRWNLRDAFDFEAERARLRDLARTPRALELRKREMLVKALGLGALDPEVSAPVVDAALVDEVLVKLDGPVGERFSTFEVVPGVLRIPVLLLPEARTAERKECTVLDVFGLSGSSDDELEAVLVLFDGAAFPTFASAFEAAQAF